MKMNKKGFTIVELVIVIAVIAILAGVLIPTFSGLVQKAQDSAAIQEARNKYTEYVGAHDYSAGTSPAQNIVIEVDDQYVIVKDAKLVDKVYDNKDVAKNDAKYTNGTAAAFLCDEHEKKATAETTGNFLCVDCNECIVHEDGADEGTVCDGCDECYTHAWQQNPATGVCTVCYTECKHVYDAGDTDTDCNTCGKVK